MLLLALALPSVLRAAEYRYAIREGGFWIHNGASYFNRPLFGTHEPSMLLSGDRPAFAYFAPTDFGKIGTLYIGVITARGGKWLHQFSEIDSVYQPGLTRHIVEDPGATTGSLEVTAVPLSTVEGFAIRLRWIKPPAEKVRLVWAMGGASGYNVNYEPLIEKLRLAGDDTVADVGHIWGRFFSLTSSAVKGKVLWGTCDLPGAMTFRDAREVERGPQEAEGAAPSTRPAIVFAGDWSAGAGPVHLLFTMAGSAALDELSGRSASTFEESVHFYRDLARRVQVKTPDPYFNLAVEAMVIANDGLWQPPSFLHGAMSWMMHFLGWRGWYGSEVLGWHDRVLTAILAFAARQIESGDDRGAVPDMLVSKGVYYNMEEVYLDHIYFHYLWTGDRKTLAALFPVIEGILSWEKRRLDPDDDALYENCLNTWISDTHWYSGGDCTQASAYMFRGNQLAVEAAEAAGKDPLSFREEAERIRRAMNDRLWLRSSGHYAEFIDRLGLKRLHPEPELPTLYHPIDFGLTDSFQAYQMLSFTERHLRNETEIPRGGRLVWSSNWAPNYDRHYTHSTYDLVFAENLNLAIAYYRAGQFDRAYQLVKGVYASMYQGGIPGGLSCHAYSNGQQRANEEFGDAISMFARTAVEGVFGILPEMQHGIIHVSPGFPRDWKDAAISTPDLSYQFHKTDSEITLEVTTVQPAQIHYRVPLSDGKLVEVTMNGAAAGSHVEPGIGESFVDVTGPPGHRSTLRIRFAPRPEAVEYPAVVAPGERLKVRMAGPYRELKDPQGLLEQITSSEQAVSGTVKGSLGPHTLFVRVGDLARSRWEPVNVEVRAPIEILGAQPDSNTGRCRFTLRNNTLREVSARGEAVWAGRTTPLDIQVSSGAKQGLTSEGDLRNLLPGKNLLALRGLPGGGALTAQVLYWPPTAPPALHQSKWKLVRLDQFYNESLSTVLSHPFWTADTDYPYAVCRDYMLAHLVGDRSGRPNDRLLRARVSEQGVFVTHAGIPFAARATGNNLVALSRWKEFPDSLRVPIDDAARKLYLLISGVTFPMQSQIANVRIEANYADGGKTQLDLVNPENFDTGWAGFYGGNYHYAANGLEVIGSGPPEEMDVMSRYMPRARPGTILGQQGVPEPLDYSKWATATHADIVDMDLDPARKIRDVVITVLSNEIIVAVHGVTLLK